MGKFDKLDALMATRQAEAVEAGHIAPAKVMPAEGWTGRYVRHDGTTTCCNAYTKIGDYGEFCRGCGEFTDGPIDDDGHPML